MASRYLSFTKESLIKTTILSSRLTYKIISNELEPSQKWQAWKDRVAISVIAAIYFVCCYVFKKPGQCTEITEIRNLNMKMCRTKLYKIEQWKVYKPTKHLFV